MANEWYTSVFTGSRFDKLHVEGSVKQDPEPTDIQGVVWNCRCDCGLYVQLKIRSLMAKGKHDCGCSTDVKRSLASISSSQTAQSAVLKSYKLGARSRKILWSMTDQEFKRLLSQPCHYCNVASSNVITRKHKFFSYNGVDRKDNRVGYERINCVACCGTCNFMKRDTDYQVFLAYVKRIHDNLQLGAGLPEMYPEEVQV